VSEYRKQLENWLANLNVKADTVFDVGGKQGEVKSRVKNWEVRDYRVMDLPEFDIQVPQIFKEKADVVFCLEVFEYLISPVPALFNIREMLKDGGEAFVTFAFCYPHHNELEMDALRYTEPGIRRMAKHIGLDIAEIAYRVDNSGLLRAFYAKDGMRMAKQYPNHDVTGFIVRFTK